MTTPPHPGGRRRGASVKCSFADETPGGSVLGIGKGKPVSQRGGYVSGRVIMLE